LRIRLIALPSIMSSTPFSTTRMNVNRPSTYRVGNAVRAKTLNVSPTSVIWPMNPSATRVLETELM
jgi:hypothetical protein